MQHLFHFGFGMLMELLDEELSLFGRRVCMLVSFLTFFKENEFFLNFFRLLGQGLKDIIRWPRPGYPVEKLQDKWGMEYGMPSTHAMVAVSIPCSVLIYTMDR